MIVNFLLKKRILEFNELKKELYSEIREEKEKNRKLKRDLDVLIRKHKRINYLLNDRVYKKRSKIFIDKTKKGVEVLVVVNEEGIEIEIFDLETKYYAENRSMVLWANRNVIDEEAFFIKDIQGGNSLGHGELILKYLFEIAKKNKILKIGGRVSSGDFDHIERLKYFYKKMGFVGNYDNMKGGDLIVKYL